MESENKTGYLYRHVRVDNGEIFYIGIGTSDGYRFNRAYKKVGRNFLWNAVVNETLYEVDILMWDVPYDELKIKEMEFIKIYGKIINNTGILTNVTDGGNGSHGFSIPSNKKGKSVAEIFNDPERTKNYIKNIRKPFILTIHEENKNPYEIFCSHREDFFEKTKMWVPIFIKLQNTGEAVIIRRMHHTKHNFPVGTKITMEYIKRDKIPTTIIKKKKYGRSFTLQIKEPNKDEYELSFDSMKECYKELKLDAVVMVDLSQRGERKILHRHKRTKHLYPKGTMIKLKFVE